MSTTSLSLFSIIHSVKTPFYMSKMRVKKRGKRREKGSKLTTDWAKNGICSKTSFYQAMVECGFEVGEIARQVFA